MESIRKRLGELRDEVGASTVVEKKRGRIEFMSGLMAAHEHRVSLLIMKGRLKGSTERVNGHIHKVDTSVDEQGDILGFSGMADNHKHRVKFRIKDFAKGGAKDKKKK